MAGLIQPGNIDLTKRPVVRNPDGSYSTVRSMSIGIDGQEVLIPTVSDDGRVLGDEEAIDLFRKTGQHLGKFDSVDAANAYAEQLHNDQAKMYADKAASAPPTEQTTGLAKSMINSFRNPLTVGASGQTDGSAYRALAESLAQQQGQAGPSSGLNALNAVLGVLAQQTNLNRAGEADQAYEARRMKQYEEFQTRQADEERARATAAGTESRKALEQQADQIGLQGAARVAFINSGGTVPDSVLNPKQADPYAAWLAQLPPDKQAQAFQVKAGLAPRAQAPAQNTGPDPLAIQRELEWYQTLSPEQRQQVDHLKGRDKGGMTVYDPQTGNPIYQTGGGGDLTTPVKTGLQGDILGAQESMADLAAIGDKFAGNYLTYSGRGKAALGGVLDKAGFDNNLTDFNADRTAFVNNLNQTFNQYRKEITGAAAGEKEMQQLLSSMMNENQGPEEFQASFAQFKQAAARNMALKQQQLQGGLPQIAPNSGPGTPRARRRYNPQTDSFD